MKRNRTFSGLLLLAGAILVAAAVGLALLSVWKSAAQRDERTEAAHRLQMLTAEPIAGVIGDHADEEMPRLELNGRDYIGLIELPEYGVSLPVAADWDTGLSRSAPRATVEHCIAGHWSLAAAAVRTASPLSVNWTPENA